MVQDAVIAHRRRRLDPQPVDDAADAGNASKPLKRKPLDGDRLYFGFDGGDTVGIDGQGLRLEVGTDPLLAAKRCQGPFAEVFSLGHALLLRPAAVVS